MVKGWIAKSLLSADWPFDREGELHVYSKKGKEIEWHKDDWPPVEIIVFEAEKIEEVKFILTGLLETTPGALTALEILKGNDGKN